MQINFVKYHGTGNDFVIIDNRKKEITDTFLNHRFVKSLCNRRFGIGADGLMLLESEKNYDFRMRYFNSDGHEGSMCGNGGRCIAAFAYRIGAVKNKSNPVSIRFTATDGEHEAKILSNSPLIVKLKMSDIVDVAVGNEDYFLDTGSPHYVVFRDDVDKVDVFKEGKNLRYDKRFAPEGINVNFISFSGNRICIRTYERGVENETLSCGTGSIASTISAVISGKIRKSPVEIKTKGGLLKVHYETLGNNTFTAIWLEGPAQFVFEGKIEV